MFRVLAVTTDPSLRGLLESTFANTPYHLTFECSAASAAPAAAATASHCLLLDQSMGADCQELEAQIWSQCPSDGKGVSILLARLDRWQAGDHNQAGCDFVVFPELGAEHLSTSIQAVVERQQAQRDLREIEQLALLGTVSAGVLHELKNPLNNVLGGMDRVLELVEDQPAAHRWAALIRRNGELLRTSLTDLLGGFRSDEPLQEVDLPPLLDRAAAYVLKGDVSHRSVHLNFEIPSDLPRVLGSSSHLLHLFLNLLVNARQATEEIQGTITLRASVDPEASMLVVDVEDNGPGIPADLLQQLFENSRSTKVGGSGFGLLFCRKIVDRHHGSIEASNGTSGGAHFRVRLPFAPVTA